MTEMTRHEPGTFSWMELATNDQKSSQRFYEQLFGLTSKEMPIPNDGVYVMLQKGGKDAAALYENKQAPPNWLSYISVANADESTARAKELGANIINGPFDVMDVGRMSVIADPEGAVFAIWQAGKHFGAAVRDEPGTLCWNELYTRDPAKALQFYTSLFGWTPKKSPGYIEVAAGSTPVGGIFEINEQMGPMPAHWLPYFAVDDCDATVKQAESMGGSAMMGPMDIPKVGRFAIVRDPQGAGFAVIKLQLQH